MEFLPGVTSPFWSKGRLETYKNWPFQDSSNACNPQRMAAAGFVAVGGQSEPDLVECFICGKELDGWEEEDNPWLEHMKHQPSCPYVKLKKQEERLWTITDLYRLLKIYYVKESTQVLNKILMTANEQSAQMLKDIPNVYKRSRNSRKDVN